MTGYATPTGKLRWNAGVLEQEHHHAGRYEWREVPDVLLRRDEAAAADPDFREVGEPARGAFYEFTITDATSINPARLRSVSPIQLESRPGLWREVIYDRKPEPLRDTDRLTYGLRLGLSDDPAAGATLAAVMKERDVLAERVRAAHSLLDRNQAEAQETIEALWNERDSWKAHADDLRERLKRAHEFDDRNQAAAARERDELQERLRNVEIESAARFEIVQVGRRIQTTLTTERHELRAGLARAQGTLASIAREIAEYGITVE